MLRLPERTHLSTAIVLLLLGAFVAGPTLAEDTEKRPLTLWEDEHSSHLSGTFKAAAAYFVQNNSWFANSRGNLGAKSDNWLETYLHRGIEGSYFLQNRSELYGRVSAGFASTNDTDAAGSNVPYGNVTETRVEDAYAGWRSGDVLSSLGKDFLDVSVGRQQYVAGNGFLFYSQSSNGQNRGAYWMGERQAAKFSGIVRLKSGNWKSDLIYLKTDDNPNTHTKVGGITLDYTVSEEIGGVGGGF